MNNEPRATIPKAQRLRLRRMGWGLLHQAGSVLIVMALVAFSMAPVNRALEYLLAVIIINLGIYGMIRSGINMRLRDPSLTATQILLPVLPAVYIMFFVSEPQARTAFLLMATGGLLFGMFALTRRGMLVVGALIVLAYLALLGTLALWAPERLNPQVETVVVFAYVTVLAVVALLGSFIAGLRRELRQQNHALNEAMHELEVLATRDPLTHLPNRRAIVEQLRQESSRVERRQPERNMLFVSMLDVDHFKRVNDTYGHDIGDLVLCRISDALRQALRQGDFIGRFGGEEFVILLPESTYEDAFAAAERIRKLVASLNFPELTPGDQVTISQGAAATDAKQITISQGVAAHLRGESVDATLKRADQALYEAKRQGRNQVIMAEE